MAVAIPASSGLDGVLSATLRAAGIPFHVSRKDSAYRHGLCRMLNSSVKAAAYGLRREDMINAARSGFTLLSPEEAMRLEIYCIEENIYGSHWEEPFTHGKNAEEAESLRQRLVGPILRLREALRGARNADDSLTAVFTLLEETGAYEKLEAREEKLLAEGMTA